MQRAPPLFAHCGRICALPQEALNTVCVPVASSEVQRLQQNETSVPIAFPPHAHHQNSFPLSKSVGSNHARRTCTVRSCASLRASVCLSDDTVSLPCKKQSCTKGTHRKVLCISAINSLLIRQHPFQAFLVPCLR